jgi:hypothetical protein
MGKKIFVSYKYADWQVRPILQFRQHSTVRDYVDVLQYTLDKSNHIYKGENDNEDLSNLAESTIRSKLSDKIFDSTVTIVFISKGMRELGKPEYEQWIPWEISCSLRRQNKGEQVSIANAILAVVIPDEYGYDYYTSYYAMGKFPFEIIRGNMFNLKDKSKAFYSNGEPIESESYINIVKWDDFIDNIDHCINFVLKIRSHIDEYDIKINMNKPVMRMLAKY